MTALWDDTLELPATLARTLDTADGFAEVGALLARPGVRRVVSTGNGAAYYAAQALWLASLGGRPGPPVLALPAGVLAGGGVDWREGDVLLAFSASGELRDLIDVLDAGAPAPFAVVTASAGSTLGRRAEARALVHVAHQRAVTHTQAFCGNVAAALAVWSAVTDDAALSRALAGLPDTVAATLPRAAELAAGLDASAAEATAAIAFGTGPAWAGALEAALLLKEVAGIPAEGVETREGATSAMYALAEGHLALSLPLADDALAAEAERVCAGRGAAVVRVEGAERTDARLAAVSSFPAAVAVAERLGLARGLDVDAPAWTETYLKVARSNA